MAEGVEDGRLQSVMIPSPSRWGKRVGDGFVERVLRASKSTAGSSGKQMIKWSP